MLKEFKEFVMRGNVMDMAVGIIIGGAFGPIVQSLVKDILMPPIGLLMGGVDFSDLFITLKQGIPPGPYPILADAQAAGAVTINYGVFFNFVVSFLIVALAVFFLIQAFNRMKREEEPPAAEPSTKECTFCHMTIPIPAIKCGFCTSDLQKTA